MRANNKLAIAIAATLFCLPTTETVLASGLSNLDSLPATDTWYSNTTTDGISATPETDFLPNPSFVTDNVTNEVLGVLYATEIFGSDPGSLPELLSAAVVYEIDGGIDEDFYLSFELSNGATFGDTKLLADANSIAAIASISTPNKNGSTVKYTVSVNDTGVKEIPAAGKFLLQYKLENTASALATAGGKIDMKVSPTSVGQTQYLVNVSDEITVARSAQGVTIEIDGDLTVNTKISTAGGGTEFSQSTDVADGVYITQSQVRLGNIYVSHYTDDNGGKALSEDGKTQFILSVGDGGIDAATLTITDGQFVASAADPGSVYLENITAETIVDADGTTATIDLTDVMGELGGDGTLPITTPIRMDVDGVNEINIPENSPCATLHINYSNSTIADIDVPSDGSGCVTLPKIPQDGTTCWVNIIPKPEALTDRLSILITNNTGDEAELIGTMYAQDGTKLFTSVPLKEDKGDGVTETVLKANKTMRLEAKDLAMLMDGATTDNPGTWDGRATLKITTTLSDIEILALMRDMNSNINSNVSQGSAEKPQCQ